MRGTFLCLGTGGSTGIPLIGCKCAVCTSTSPRNQRLRPSALIEVGGKRLLIDVGPDFRQQALTHGVDSVDGLLLTHTHYDHIAGVDELRVFYLRTKKPLPCLLSEESFEELRKRYSYLFQPIGEVTTISAQLEFQILEQEMGETHFLGLPIQYISYEQGQMGVTGFRFGDLAYVSDICDYEEGVFVGLGGVKTLILSALSFEPSPVHLTILEAIDFARRVGAERTWLTHLNHRIDHEEVDEKLPSDVRLGYDGLKLEFSL